MKGEIELPAEPSGVWGWAHRFSHHVHTTARIREIDGILTRGRCGNCDLWMKSSLCPREHNVRGMSRGPSGDDLPCQKFVPSSRAIEHHKNLRAERAALAKSLESPSP